MKLEFNRLPKKYNVGTRLTEDEYKFVKELAGKNKSSLGETVHVLVVAAIKELLVTPKIERYPDFKMKMECDTRERFKSL